MRRKLSVRRKRQERLHFLVLEDGRADGDFAALAPGKRRGSDLDFHPPGLPDGGIPADKL